MDLNQFSSYVDPGFSMALNILGIVLAAVVIIVSIFGLVSYLLTSLGLYTVAKRRQIRHAWFAWIPLLSIWLLGSISDQYQYVAQKKNTNRRTTLFLLMAAMLAMSFLIGFAEAFADSAAFGIVSLLATLSYVGVSIAFVIISFMVLYDLYRSCKPQNATLFLVLSILFSVTEPFFIFFLRKSDDGMAPRPVYTPPAYQSWDQQ